MYWEDIVEEKVVKRIKEIMPLIEKSTGYEAGEIVYEYFCDTIHPHCLYTFEQALSNYDLTGSENNIFAINLSREMARLVAVNEMQLGI